MLKVARSRARFFRGDRDLLLYTGRAHFFNRYCIRGIHHLIFYSLPECPQFYPEMVNLLEVSSAYCCIYVGRSIIVLPSFVPYLISIAKNGISRSYFLVLL